MTMPQTGITVTAELLMPQTITVNSNAVANMGFIDQEIFVQAVNTTFYIDRAGSKPRQVRNITTDWASAALIRGFVVKGLYIYFHVRDASNNFRVYRYLLSDITSSPTQMTISGQSLGTTGGGDTYMTSNGTYFYFNNKAGNSANNYVISKYSLSGTTLTYVSDITCGSLANSMWYFIVDQNENLYGELATSDEKIRKFNSSGTLQSTTDAYPDISGLLNYNNVVFYAAYQHSDFSRYCRIFLAT